MALGKEFWCDFVAGWIAGCVGLLSGHPLDTIKVRMQTLGYTSGIKCFVETLKKEKITGLYRGMGFPFLTSGTINCIFFGVYGNTTRFINNQFPSMKDHYYTNVYISGFVAGTVQIVITTPTDLIKTKLQVQRGSNRISEYRGPFHCLVKIYKSKGIKGWYKGNVIQMYRDIPSFGLYMIMYEYAVGRSDQEIKPSTSRILIAGGLAGVATWAVVLPLDVVKARIQADDLRKPKYNGILDCAVKSYKKEGWSIFVRGFWTISIRAFYVNAVTFFAYSNSLWQIQHWITQYESRKLKNFNK